MKNSMTPSLSSPEIVERYLSFFRTRNHTQLPESPLAIPGNSTSFIIAGMQPLLPYLRGQRVPPSSRLSALQRCLRTDDADMVGTNGRKATSFFMLGNWSIGDYGKHEAIDMALELLTTFQLDLSKLWVTVFAGDPALNLPPDDEAITHWLSRGIPQARIVPLGTEDNLWTMGGPGPCGPCTELYIDRGSELSCGLPTCQPGCSCERFLEIWNLVFMEYELFTDGHVEPLPIRNIDTGMGLERIASVVQDTESIFTIDLFQEAMANLTSLAPHGVVAKQTVETRARRMIVDHTRAAMLAILAGVLPGRDGRNSVVRRLIRRAARQGRVLGIDQPFLSAFVTPIAQAHGALLTTQECLQIPIVINTIAEEEVRFERVLTIGLKYLSQLEPNQQGTISGAQLFELHAEKGFPADLAAEVLSDRGLSIDWSSYQQAREAHQRISRVSADKHFHTQ